MSSARISTTNSSVTNLLANQAFNGTKDIVGEFTKCGVSVFADQEISLLVTQSQNGVSADKVDVYTIPASTAPPPFTEFASPRISVEMSHKYVTITARNTSATATTFFRLQTQVYNEGFLTHTHDSVKLFGTTADGTHKAVLTNEAGALIVSGGGGGDASRWADFPAVDNVDMDGFALQNVTGINSTALDNLSISTAGGDIQLQTATDELNANVMSYSVLGNLSLSNGGQNINNLLGVTNSQGFKLTEEGGGSIIFSDSTVQTTAYQNPFQVDLDMNDNGLMNVNGVNGSAGKGQTITADKTVLISSNQEAVLLSSKTSIILAIPPTIVQFPELPTKTLTYDANGDLTLAEGTENISNPLGTTTSNSFTLTQGGGGVITFEDGTTQSTAGGGGGGGNFSTPSAVDLDMNTHKIIGITELGGVGLHNNPIIVNNDITFRGDSEFQGNTSITNVTRIIGNADNYLTLTNVGEISSYNATDSILMNAVNVQIGQNLYFVNDGTSQNTAYQNPFQTQLDLNGQNIIRTTNIFGNDDIIVTAGMADSTESSTLSLTNNGYAVAGTYSQLFLKPTGVELNTGDIPTAISHIAKLDTAGVFTAPKFKVGETVIDYGLDMNSSNIINVANLDSAPATNININGIDADSQVIINANNSGIGGTSTLSVAPSGVYLNALITGTEDTASALFSAQSGTFSAPFFYAQGFQPSVGAFQKGSIFTPKVNGVELITFDDLTGQTTAYTGNDVKTITSTDGSVVITTPSANTVNLSVPTPQGITANTFYVNDNVNSINDVLPLMGSGDICIVSAGSFGNTTDITWNVAQTGLSGSVAPLPLTFLTTENASRFTVSATQVRVANIKFQMPVFLSGNNCTIDNADFDDNLTVGTNVSGYVTINNCEFVGTKTITVASTFTNVVYFIGCNFLGSTFSLLNPSSSQVIFNNCAGFTSYPANATYVGINTLTAGTAQLSTNTIKSVVVGGNVTYASQINMDGNNLINVNNISGRTGDPPSFTQSFEVATGAGNIQMRGNGIVTCGTITQLLQGSTLVSLTPSQASSRNNWTVSIPFYAGGGSASFAMNDLGVFSTKSVTLTTGGEVTYPDTTTQNSGLIKGTVTLVGGTVTITDARVTTGAICVVSYADSPPVGGVLCAKVSAGQIIIESTLLADVSPVFYMYFI